MEKVEGAGFEAVGIMIYDKFQVEILVKPKENIMVEINRATLTHLEKK
jgi:hypothetical protein